MTNTPAQYHLIHRTGRWGKHGWWRPIVGIVAALVAYFVVVLVLQASFLLVLVLQGSGLNSAIDRLTDTSNTTPLLLAHLNLTLAAAIPVVMGVSWLLHGLRPRWLASVRPRLRWGWMLACFGLAFLALLATIGVAAVLPAGSDTGDLSGDLNSWSTTTRDFVLVIVLLTPLQAAGEEYAFRGYLTQAFGGLFARLGPRAAYAAAVLLPAVLFALAHGAQDAPIFVDRLAFGLVAGVLVITTGGLEAGLAMHVLNNFLAYAAALAYGDMSSALNPSGGTWWQLPVTLTQSLTFLALVTLVSRRAGIQTRTAAPKEPVLEASEPRV